MKKFLAVMLAIMLVVGIMPTAFAVATPGLLQELSRVLTIKKLWELLL